ncbi:OmpW/AlkL family protein [Dokdonella sp.]|jgi:outer membrane protein|uniref:OmpW/AlkL family protein n=1 Tax=Dokdonella sp. TaxID=2291710 RepID=UPI002F406FF5
MLRTLSLAVLLALGATAAHAEQGDWQIKLGAHAVDPKSGNGRLAGGALATDVDSAWSATVTLEYAMTPNLGVEVLAAWPFEHDVKLNGAKAATVKQLPPTVSLQWHFMPDAKVSPFVGLGVNYTRFFSIDETGPLDGKNLDLGDSWGLAAHAGIDVALAPRWSLTVDARWIDIDTDAKVDGAKVGSVAIDPLVYGVAVGYRF